MEDSVGRDVDPSCPMAVPIGIGHTTAGRTPNSSLLQWPRIRPYRAPSLTT